MANLSCAFQMELFHYRKQLRSRNFQYVMHLDIFLADTVDFFLKFGTQVLIYFAI